MIFLLKEMLGVFVEKIFRKKIQNVLELYKIQKFLDKINVLSITTFRFELKIRLNERKFTIIERIYILHE